MMENIVDLVEGAKRKEQYAITQLYVAAKDKALYIAKDMLKDEDEAQDVVQDAFIKAFDNLGSLERPEKFQGWLDTIVINRCRDLLRKKRPMLFTQLARDDENDATLQWEDTNEEFQPEASVDYAETRRLIKEMIDSLPDPQRIATTLFYLEDMSVRDIAVFMGCSENTVKSRLNLARKNIKAQVLALEKKGTKLYCVPFIPFLYWMFKQEIAVCAAVRAGTAAVGIGAVGTGAAGGGATGTGVAGTGAAGTGVAGSGVAGTGAAGGGAAGTGAAGGGAAGTGAARTGAAGTGAAGGGAAGTGAAGTGAVGTGEAGAGTAAAAATAKGAGVGIAVKAAIAVLAVTAAVGAGVAVSHFNYQKTGPASASWTETRQDQESGNGRDTYAATAAVELSSEELAALKALYALKDTRDPDEYMECMMENRQILYNLCNDKLEGGQYLFTGEVMEATDTGTGVYLKDPNTVYAGDLAVGLPHGNGNLGRWFWGYNSMSGSNCLSMGKAFSVLIGDSYLGGWSGGVAQGAGVVSQREFQEYSGFDMGVYEQAKEVSCQGNAYANTMTSANYVNGLADGPVEYRTREMVFSYNTHQGTVVIDDHVVQEDKGGRVRYYVTAQDGENQYGVDLDRVIKAGCRWDSTLPRHSYEDLAPKGPLIQDWAYIRFGEAVLLNVPFDDYPKFTADVLNYAITQGYVSDLDMISDHADGFIFLDGEPVITDEYIQFHFYVESVRSDEYPEFDFRYYFNGSNAGADGGTADQTQGNQADEDLMNQVNTAALQQFIASTWDAVTPDDYEAKVNNRLSFTGEKATDGQKRGLVYLLACNSGENWNTGAVPNEEYQLKVTREVYDEVLDAAIGTLENTSAWKENVAEIQKYYPEAVGPDESYLMFLPGDYGMDWPASTIEETESLGNGLYKVSGRVGYIEEQGEIPELPYEAVFKSNPGSMFMGLTLVTLTTNQ